MKKILITLSFLMTWFSAWAQNPRTSDHLEIEEAEVELGGDVSILSINLSGETLYTAFGFDLYLPAGYEYDLDGSDDWINAINSSVEDYEIYPFTTNRGKKSYSHTLYANIQSDGALRITILSGSSESFLSTTGKIVEVYVKTTAYAKPGPASIQLKNCFFVTSTGVQYDTNDITISDKVSATSTTSIPFSVSAANQLSTCILPFATDIPDGVKAYECTEVGNDGEGAYLVLTEADAFEAYTPYIVYAEEGCNTTLEGTVDASNYPAEGFVKKGMLCGSIEPQMVSEGYVMQNKGEGAMFYNMNNKSFLVPSGKCWLAPTGNNAAAIRFRFEDPTGIKTAAKPACEDGAIYDLQGVKVNSTNSGQIYIKGNKKYIKK